MLNLEFILEGHGVLVFVTDARGAVRYVNQQAAECLGSRGQPTSGETLWDLTDHDTVRRLLRVAESSTEDESVVLTRIELRNVIGSAMSKMAIISSLRDTDGSRYLRILAFDDAKNTAYVGELEHSAEILQGFIDASNEAMWCIEYTEPVNLSETAPEIIRQVFENDCHWSKCNRAMARLYNLPDGVDLNRQRVSAYFRRSPENEAFVRQLIENSFHIDAALSIDVRHDGTLTYMENSVRCHVEGGRMLRMWGTGRDATELHTTQNRLARREREVSEILSALPDAVLVVDKTKRALAVNPAFELTFGWGAGELLGTDVSRLIDLELRNGHERRWFAPTQQRRLTDVKHRNGTLIKCDVRIAPLHDDEHRRFVLSLRPEYSPPKSPRRVTRPKRKRSPSARK